ncbi:MAG: aspartate 1-decarboxylase [Pseudomonadota bacterium]
MILTMLKAKIHRASVTQCDLHYEGSITIDTEILEHAGILPYEQVDVYNINTGTRFTTYAIKGQPGSGIIGINGAAARLAQVNDLVIICSYARMNDTEARAFTPTVLQMGNGNSVIKS